MAHPESRQVLETLWGATGQPTTPAVQSSHAQQARHFAPPMWYYYDPTRHHQSTPLSSSTGLPSAPPVELNALQSQFTAFCDSLDTISSDVKDALHQLKALHATQTKTVTRLTHLEGVIGISRGCGRRRTDNTAPEETIVEHLASIRAAIELLACPSHSPSIPLPSANLPGQDASQSVIDPSQSEALISESGTSLSGKQHTQPGLPSSALESSCSTQFSHAPTLSFTPAQQCIDSVKHGPSVGNSIRPTAFTTEYLNHFFHDAHCSTETATDGPQLPSRAVSSTPLPPHEGETVVDAQSRASDATTSSLDTDAFVVPSPLQAHSLGTQGVDCSMTSPLMTSPDGSQTLPTSVLCVSSAATVAPNADHAASDSDSGQSQRSNPEDVHAGHDDSPVTNTVQIVIEPASVVQAHCQQSSGSAFCLPTSSSEASIGNFEPQAVNELTRDHAAAANTTVDSCTSPLLKLPVIPTPPSLTPEPSGGEGRSVVPSTRPTGFDSGLPSPLTPVLTPSTVDGILPLEEGVRDVNREVEASKVTEEHGNPSDDVEGNTTEGLGGDTPVDAPASAINTGTPVISVTNELLSHVDSSQIPDDVEPSATSRSEQPHVELPKDAPRFNGSHSQVDGYIRFSSLAKLASAPPSRYETPSESAGGLPTPDEDEVWNALMLDASGLSTPAPDDTLLPLMTPHQSSRAMSIFSDASQHLSGSTPVNDVSHDHGSFPSAPVLLAVDPSVLHDPPLQCHGPEPPDSPLTSIAGSDDVERDGEASRASSPVATLHQRGVTEATLVGGRTGPRPLLGGPGASLDELTVLARRAPPKILLKLPKTALSLKRKRDDVDDDNEGRAEVAAVTPGSVLSTPTPDATSTSLIPVAAPSYKRTREHGKFGGNATPQKKVRRARGTKPRSLISHHVHNGQIVTVNMFAALESQAQASMTPLMPQSPVHGGEACQGSQASSRRRKRNGNQTKSTMPPSVTSNRHARSSAKIDDVRDLIYEHSGMWPELPDQFEHWDLQFIQCDNCDKWYHYGCVGIIADDPRLGPGVYFECPECYTQDTRRRTARRRENVCKRPDCPEPQITGDTEMFYVEKLVGRKKVDEDTYMWLAKWDGYPMSEATWIPKENVVGDGTRMFDVFAEDAVEEGVDLSRNVLLLREALDAGFGEEDG